MMVIEMKLTKLIKTKEEYHEALDEAHKLVLLDPEHDTPDAERLDLLTLLINDYEHRTFKIDFPDPVDAIKFVMEQQQLKQRDLIPFVGSKSRVSEILNRKKPLTLPIIRNLSKNLQIPIEILAREPEKSSDKEQTIFM